MYRRESAPVVGVGVLNPSRSLDSGRLGFRRQDFGVRVEGLVATCRRESFSGLGFWVCGVGFGVYGIAALLCCGYVIKSMGDQAAFGV